VTDAEVITEPSILYFGYTFCPDVCPLDVARNADAVDLLAARGLSVTPVFISIDPARDTPEVVGDFAANLHERMIGLTGSEDQVKAASQAYRTYYRAQQSDDEYYLVDHSTFSYLVLPEHGFVEFYRREVSPEEMAESVACFVENA
jgi:protein SCO1/2